MSEARKKLEEEASKHEYTGRLPSDTPFTSMYGIEEIRRKEQEVKEKIKRKQEEIKRQREELRLKKEEQLVRFKNNVRHMIGDEEGGIKYYEGLIIQARALETPWSLLHVKDLEIILSDERRHLASLNAIMR